VTTVLGLVLRHNAWANRALLEHCAALGPSALDLEAAGTYGTLYGTLQHLVSGEQFYVELLTDEVIGAPIRKTERRTLDDLIAISAKTGSRAIEIAASEDPERVIGDRGSDDWTTAGIVLAQLVNHGNEHRAHGTTILGANGRTPPKIGAWSYGIANGISKNDGD
jgi:uncharacterized damage-inducible protein DinB